MSCCDPNIGHPAYKIIASLVREHPNGTRETLASHFEGRELNSPNDVCVGKGGSIYFSDPTYGRLPGFGSERDQDLDFQGVFRIPPGGDLELIIERDRYAQPNGLCFSPDGNTLISGKRKARETTGRPKRKTPPLLDVTQRDT